MKVRSGMAKRKKKPRKSIESTTVQTSIGLDEILAQAENHLEQENPEAALETLEQLSARQQNHPDALFIRGSAHLLLGNRIEAVENLQAASYRLQSFPPVFINLAFAYSTLGWIRHAWLNAELYLRKKPDDFQFEQMARDIVNHAKETIDFHARTMGVPAKRLARASLPHESAQLYLNQDRYAKVLNETKKAIRMVPNWPSPRNNRTLAYFFMGRLKEAGREAKEVLRDVDADNEHALGNLIKIYTSTLRREEARPYAERLIAISKNSSMESLDVPKVIEALAEWEDDQAFWDFGKRVLETYAENLLPGSCWYQIGAAAANTRNWPEARKCFERSQRQGGYVDSWIEAGIKASKQAVRSKKLVSGPSLDGKFQYFTFTHFFRSSLLDEFLSLEEEGQDSELMDKFVQRYPFLAGAYRLLLWSDSTEMTCTMALNALTKCGTPGAYAEVRRFAKSSCGTDDERVEALQLLTEAGQHNPAESIKFWVSAKQEWTEIVLISQEISDPNEPSCGPEVMDLLERSYETAHEGDLEQTIQLLKKAVELEPDCAQAVHNLGVQYMNSGEREKGESLICQSVKIDPDYLYGHTTLADLALGRKDFEACKDHLQPIFRAKVVYPEVMRRTLMIQVRLGLELDDPEFSEAALKSLENLFPDDPELEHLGHAIRFHDIDVKWRERWLNDVHRYRLRKLKQSITADEKLTACLDRVSSENLVGTLNFWGLSTSGRKAVRIARIVETILDISALTEFVDDDLGSDERAALEWMLEGEGVRPWEEFIDKFGDDFDESPYWQWHEPETVPGCLRMFGVLAVGTLDGQQVALIPADLRPLLQQVLSSHK
jgi:tetratricopeptide (TPR) repeat protein